MKIRARCSSTKQNEIRSFLKQKRAEYIGTNRQNDTYFEKDGLIFKLRKKRFENYLIFYKDEKDERGSKIEPYPLIENSCLEKVIRSTYPTLTEVDLQRDIYFIGNVKFHLDSIKNLGYFVEIRALSKDNQILKSRLQEQCCYYKNLFGIKDSDLIKNKNSYSDMLLEIRKVKDAVD